MSLNKNKTRTRGTKTGILFEVLSSLLEQRTVKRNELHLQRYTHYWEKSVYDYFIQKCPSRWVQNCQRVTPKRTHHGDKKEAICW